MKKIKFIGLVVALLGVALLQGCGGGNNAANDALIQAASKGDVAAAQAALSEGAEVNHKDKSAMDMTPLMVAASYGHAPMVKLLLDKGADATIKNHHVSALRLAETPGPGNKGREQEFEETIRLLRQAGAKE